MHLYQFLFAVVLLAAFGCASAGDVLWCGNVTSSSATFTFVTANPAEFSVSTSSDLQPALYKTSVGIGASRITVTGLSPATQYFYGVSGNVGQFRTFQNGPMNFTMGFSSCARSHSNSVVFREMMQHNLTFFINMGDLHYEDIPVNDVDRFRSAYKMVFDQPNQKDFYKSMPIAYVFDDHDFGPNDATGDSPSTPAAQRTYREYFPHYDLPATDADGLGAIYQAFTVGSVRFIMMDTRSEQRLGQRLMSTTQLNWIMQELSNHTMYSMVVLVSSQPWIGPETVGDTNWMAYPEARRQLANFVASNNITNLVMMSGDAHMIAYDDGTNSDYNNITGGAAGFPVFQSASLDRPGSTKGGPYSEGCFAFRIAMTNQFSTMQFTDYQNGTICIEVNGYRASDMWSTGSKLVTMSMCSPFVKKGAAGVGRCASIPQFPNWAQSGLLVVYILAATLLLTAIVAISPKACCKKEKVPRARLAGMIVFMLTIIVIAIIAIAPNISMPGLNIWELILAQGILDGIFLIFLIVLVIAWHNS